MSIIAIKFHFAAGVLAFALVMAACSDKDSTLSTSKTAPTNKEFEEETKKIAQPFNQVALLKCSEDRGRITEEFDKHFAGRDYGGAAEIVRHCATTFGSADYKQQLKNAEIAGFEVEVNNEKHSAYSRLATLNAYEKSYPDEAAKYASLRIRLVGVNAKEMKNEEERKRIEQAANDKKERIEEARYRRSQGVEIGMTPEEVLASSWGRPRRTTKSQSSNIYTETWDYGYPNFLYFVNGQLSQIHN